MFLIAGAECKKKWRYLRDKYIKERKTLKANNKNSSRTMWKYFHLMYFLDPTLTTLEEDKETVSIFLTDQDFANNSETTAEEEVANDHQNADPDYNPFEENVASSASEERPGPSRTKRSVGASQELPGPSSKKRKKPWGAGGGCLVDAKIPEASNTLYEVKVDEAPCPDTQFLLSLLPFVKKVPEDQKLPLRMAMMEAVHRASQKSVN